jgi:hypothetical protein
VELQPLGGGAQQGADPGHLHPGCQAAGGASRAQRGGSSSLRRDGSSGSLPAGASGRAPPAKPAGEAAAEQPSVWQRWFGARKEEGELLLPVPMRTR